MYQQGDTMPSSAVRTFTDPDDYGLAIRATRAELTVTGRGRFAAKIVRIDLHDLWMQRFSDNLPRVAHSAAMTGRAIISFPTEPGPDLVWAGAELRLGSIVRHSEGESSFQRSSGSAYWGAMSLPMGTLASIGPAITGYDLTPPKDALTVAPLATVMARLQRLHAAVADLAEEAPAIIANPDAARGLEQALIEVMAASLCGGEAREDRSALRQHALVMRRFRRATEEDPDQPLYMPELCTTIGVSHRTLLNCCQEQLGMSPKRYLLLRRMNLAHRALRDSPPAATTVTEVATRFGFWQFGRFAGEYRALFGELPSATLGRRPV